MGNLKKQSRKNQKYQPLLALTGGLRNRVVSRVNTISAILETTGQLRAKSATPTMMIAMANMRCAEMASPRKYHAPMALMM